MIKNTDIICISSIDWDFVWQGHQEIMSTFSKNGNRVLFIENTGVRTPNLKDFMRLRRRFRNWLRGTKGFHEEMPNLYVYSPVILPLPYSRAARMLNKFLLIRALKRWMKSMDFHDPIVWTFLPTGTALDIIDNTDPKLLVYYCIADFYELSDNPQKTKEAEDELIKKCDLVFTQGKSLHEKCSRLNKNVHIFPFGVRTGAFDQLPGQGFPTPPEMRGIKKPIIGYVGGIHRHIDFELIGSLAKKHPEWSIVLVGPLQIDDSAINGHTNIHLLGKKDFQTIPSYIQEFDVCIIPYIYSKYTNTVYPTKLNEYHAMGKAVVSTELPEVVAYNEENNSILRIGRSAKDFENHIIEALKKDGAGMPSLRKACSKKNDWGKRIGQMSRLIEESIREKKKNNRDWKLRLIKLYKNKRNAVLKAIFFLSAAYLALFYTPLIWFIAEPLRTPQGIEQANCIVVFAGGVGESGKAGQGYEERVKLAVELYKNNYAPRMIFCSGYTYIFKEPLLMKALAISLGVPEGAIILEDRAKNTYENILASKTILERGGWNKIILITSPYHLRRAILVFKKVAPGITVFRPILENSLFYAHPERDASGSRIWKRANLVQIKAVLHEYSAIIYYSLKGYI